jgi:hypothetical protein
MNMNSKALQEKFVIFLPDEEGSPVKIKCRYWQIMRFEACFGFSNNGTKRSLCYYRHARTGMGPEYYGSSVRGRGEQDKFMICDDAPRRGNYLAD